MVGSMNFYVVIWEEEGVYVVKEVFMGVII